MAAKRQTAAKGAKKAPQQLQTAPAAEAKRRMAAHIKRVGTFARGGYRPVCPGGDMVNRPFVTAETGDELQQVPASERNRLIALARNTFRNNEHFQALVATLCNHVVGVEGGKAVFSAPAGYEYSMGLVKKRFAEFAASAEYFDDLNLNTVLKLILRTLLIGGDCAIAMDDGLTRDDTGQILVFEPDEIANLAEMDFKNALGDRYTQHQGILKNRNGKTVGVVCSVSQRGRGEFRLFDEQGRRAAWTLVKPAGLPWTESPFTMLRNFSRINEMRGESPFWSSLGSLNDMIAVQGYAVQLAKRNSQVMGQILQGEAETGEAALASELDPDAVAPEPVDAGGEGDTPLEEEIVQESISCDELTSHGLIWDLMPPGVKAEVLSDPNLPSLNTIDFSRWLHGGAAWAAGLSKIFSTGESTSSYSGSMAEMILARTSFTCEFKRLETGFLDWVLLNWSRRAQRLGAIPQDDELPEDWRRTCVSWMQPPEKALNPVDDANATTIQLRNGTTSWRQKLGPDWKARLLEIEEEIEFAKAHGIPDPRLQTVSGGLVTASTPNEENK